MAGAAAGAVAGAVAVVLIVVEKTVAAQTGVVVEKAVATDVVLLSLVVVVEMERVKESASGDGGAGPVP